MQHFIFIHSHMIVVGYYGFRLLVCVSVNMSLHASVSQDDNLSKFQRIFINSVMCIDIVGIWVWIANGQILSVFDIVICWTHNSNRVLLFHVLIFISFFQYVKVIVKVMTECWSGTPAARLTSLRVKKTLSKLSEILEANEKLDKLQSIQP